jgi:hypothetical protein
MTNEMAENEGRNDAEQPIQVQILRKTNVISFQDTTSKMIPKFSSFKAPPKLADRSNEPTNRNADTMMTDTTNTAVIEETKIPPVHRPVIAINVVGLFLPLLLLLRASNQTSSKSIQKGTPQTTHTSLQTSHTAYPTAIRCAFPSIWKWLYPWSGRKMENRS